MSEKKDSIELEKIVLEQHSLNPEHLTAFWVLSQLRRAQRSIKVRPFEISKLAHDCKLAMHEDGSKVFNSEDFYLKRTISGWSSENVHQYLGGLLDLNILVSPDGSYLANPDGIDYFKKIVNKLYEEHPDLTKEYVKLVECKFEDFF